MRASVSRNSACPCGSGRKYKRCCLAVDERAERAARFDDAVGRRIQDWSSEALGEEISAALEEFVGPDRTMDDDDVQIFATWFHNDREVSGGGTPADRYAARPGLPEDELAAASRIAGARLGFHLRDRGRARKLARARGRRAWHADARAKPERVP